MRHLASHAHRGALVHRCNHGLLRSAPCFVHPHVFVFIINQTPATLLNYYSTDFGIFTTSPPQSVGPYGRGNLTVIGTGFIEYDVYYSSTAFVGCLRLSCLWDLVIGKCDSGVTDCPANIGALTPDAYDFPDEGTLSIDDAARGYYVQDECPILGDPAHLIKYGCNQRLDSFYLINILPNYLNLTLAFFGVLVYNEGCFFG